MRKTIYKTLVKTYVTCEERCALDRVIHALKVLLNRQALDSQYLYLDGVSISTKDISDLKDLVDFVRNEETAPIVTFGLSAPDDVNVEYIGEE